MRSTVVNWLVEIHMHFKMHTDVLYFAVNYIDRYLSLHDIDKALYQRLASAAIILAAKVEEVYAPKMEDLVKLAGNSFTALALSRMEHAVYSTLDCRLNPVLPTQFLKHFLRVIVADVKLLLFSHYIMESSLLGSSFIGLRPSLIAAASICLASCVLNGYSSWTLDMVQETGYTLNDLSPTILLLKQTIQSNSKSSHCQAIFQKYSAEHMQGVALIAIPNAFKK